MCNGSQRRRERGVVLRGADLGALRHRAVPLPPGPRLGRWPDDEQLHHDGPPAGALGTQGINLFAWGTAVRHATAQRADFRHEPFLSSTLRVVLRTCHVLKLPLQLGSVDGCTDMRCPDAHRATSRTRYSCPETCPTRTTTTWTTASVTSLAGTPGAASHRSCSGRCLSSLALVWTHPNPNPDPSPNPIPSPNPNRRPKPLFESKIKSKP